MADCAAAPGGNFRLGKRFGSKLRWWIGDETVRVLVRREKSLDLLPGWRIRSAMFVEKRASLVRLELAGSVKDFFQFVERG
ncbi:MAG TPA: hypothetical protein VG095_10205 [Chthoniobacterales bacterium]|nr:hypothetical protein [Chthoniobacterales bacterium]